MGQQISSSLDGERNQEPDSQPVKQELSAVEKNKISQSIHCVKTRIDMLIEDCLTESEDLGNVSSSTSSSTCHISSTVDNTSQSENECSSEQKCVSATESVFDKRQSDIENNEPKHVLEGIEPKCELESNPEDLESSNGTKMDRKESTDKCGVKNVYKSNEGEKDVYLMAERNQRRKTQLAVSDLILDIVSSEITQGHLLQLQKRTVTTFNTFIDKVLDSSLKMEAIDKLQPTNILKLCCETHPTTNFVSSFVRKSPNKADRTENKNVGIQDHIDNLVEASLQDDNVQLTSNFKKDSTVTAQEKFNAQELVNGTIKQGLVNGVISQGFVNGMSAHELRANVQNVVTKKATNHIDKDIDSLKSQSFLNKKSTQENLGLSDNSVVHDNLVSDSLSSTKQCVNDEKRNRQSDTSLNASNQHYEEVQHYGDRVVNEKRCYRKEHVLQENRSCLKSPFTAQSTGSDGSGMSLQSSHPVTTNLGYKSYDEFSPHYKKCEMRNPIIYDGKQIVHTHSCQCTLCAPPHSNIRETRASDYNGSGNHSPNMYQHTSCHMPIHPSQCQMLNVIPAIMRPAHLLIPPCYSSNPNLPQPLLHPSPIVSSKECDYVTRLTPDLELRNTNNGHIRRLSDQELVAHLPYLSYQRYEDGYNPVNGENSQYTVDSDKLCLSQPATVPSLEQSGVQGNSNHSMEECCRNNDSQSGSCDGSLEAPLDLTVKYTQSEPARQCLSTKRKLTPDTFIKYIESSVERHWLELSSSSPGAAKKSNQCCRSAMSYNDNLISTPSPGSTSSTSSFMMHHGRRLPSPHVAVSMMSEQPLTDIKLPVLQQSSKYQHVDVLQTDPLLVQQHHQQQAQLSVNHSDFGTSGKHHLNNVSKHEPIQNIIGHHDQNDILYLICRLCTQTYGSPYGFRKHFRNQHGYEPQAEHAIVQTISATKSVLHGPHTGSPHNGFSHTGFPHSGSLDSHKDELIVHQNVTPQSSPSELKNPSFDIQMLRTFISLPSPGFNVRNVELDVESGKSNTKSVLHSPHSGSPHTGSQHAKCLECPECSKSFQLNDFGSYKHHCRQHCNLKTNGHSTCSDCDMQFPNHKLIEYYREHTEESLGMQQVIHSNATVLNLVSLPTCDQHFDNLSTFTQHKASRDVQVKQPESLKVSKIVGCSLPGNGQQEKRNDKCLNFVTQEDIVVRAAESMTSLACPDSSWDDNDQNIKTIDGNSDEGGQQRGNKNIYSSDTSTGNSDSQKDFSQERADDSDNRFSDESEFMYKHKKFFHFRKRIRTTSSSDSTEATDSKLRRANDGTQGDNSLQVTGSVSTKGICDSSNVVNTKLKVPG